jgi:hypothetical protein
MTFKKSLLNLLMSKLRVGSKPKKQIVNNPSNIKYLTEIQRTIIDNSISNLEKFVEKMADQARIAVNETFDGFGYNRNNEFIEASEALHWQTFVNIFDLAVCYDRNAKNYYSLGHALLNLVDHVPKEKKVEILHRSIFHLKKAEEIDTYYWDCRLLGIGYSELGDEFGGNEQIQAYCQAEEIYRNIIGSEEGQNDSWINGELGNIICELADSAENFYEKMDRRKEGISYLQRSIRLKSDEAYFRFSLGEEFASLAEDTMNLDQKKRRYNFAIKHLQKSYDLDKDLETLEFIEEIRQENKYL